MSTPAKRKPGRPRKNPVATTVELPPVIPATPVAPETNGHAVPVEVKAEPPKFAPLPEKVRILVGSLSYDGMIRQEVMGYISGLYAQMGSHPRLGEIRFAASTGYPCDRVRNELTYNAIQGGFNYLLMLDADMKFDFLVGQDPTAKPFLPTALDFALAHDGPCVVAAPYTGGPPEQRVMVMRWRDRTPDMTMGEGMALESFTREEAAERTGIERVAGLPTGCMLIDLRFASMYAPPWFAYEFKDPPLNTKLASTEDIFFSRNLDWLGIPQFCTWDCWASHIKVFHTGKPRMVNPNDVPRAVWKAAKAGRVPAQFDV